MSYIKKVTFPLPKQQDFKIEPHSVYLVRCKINSHYSYLITASTLSGDKSVVRISSNGSIEHADLDYYKAHYYFIENVTSKFFCGIEED